jgi:hypothetical protein
MGRHNRDGRGEDQFGRHYEVAYQPDWLHQVKVSRGLESGRQSTKILLRNPDPPVQAPGSRVRTRVACPELGLDFEVALRDSRGAVRRIIVETVIPDGPEAGETVRFTLARAGRQEQDRPQDQP